MSTPTSKTSFRAITQNVLGLAIPSLERITTETTSSVTTRRILDLLQAREAEVKRAEKVNKHEKLGSQSAE